MRYNYLFLGLQLVCFNNIAWSADLNFVDEMCDGTHLDKIEVDNLRSALEQSEQECGGRQIIDDSKSETKLVKDVFNWILLNIRSPKDMVSFALTCRENYKWMREKFSNIKDISEYKLITVTNGDEYIYGQDIIPGLKEKINYNNYYVAIVAKAYGPMIDNTAFIFTVKRSKISDQLSFFYYERDGEAISDAKDGVNSNEDVKTLLMEGINMISLSNLPKNAVNNDYFSSHRAIAAGTLFFLGGIMCCKAVEFMHK